jgi:hypothetical protein
MLKYLSQTQEKLSRLKRRRVVADSVIRSTMPSDNKFWVLLLKKIEIIFSLDPSVKSVPGHARLLIGSFRLYSPSSHKCLDSGTTGRNPGPLNEPTRDKFVTLTYSLVVIWCATFEMNAGL